MDIIIFYIIFIFLTLFIISYTLYCVYLRLIPGAFYYPSTENHIQTMIKLVKLKNKNVLIDLGSGDGKRTSPFCIRAFGKLTWQTTL